MQHYNSFQNFPNSILMTSRVGVKLLCSMSRVIGADGGDEVRLSLGVLLTTFSAPQIGDWQICGHWNTPLWEDYRHPRTDRTGGKYTI